MAEKSYVLITSARNEEAYIERTIKAVIAQTVLPVKWVIISDGSTDRTDDIVQSYSNRFEFIEFISSKGDHDRNFGSKARAVGLGILRTKNIEHEFIGNLDADVSFEPTYYETILSKFERDQNLGIAGGDCYELYGEKFKKIVHPKNSVGGPIQFFRRQCYEEIGGYLSLKHGGIDAAAEITARMKGWKVETFHDFKFYHYRSTGSANKSYAKTKFKYGLKNYVLGYHPAFFTLMILKRMTRPGKYLLGGPIEIFGYIWGAMKKEIRPFSNDIVKYLRAEQLYRIKTSLLTGKDPANS